MTSTDKQKRKKAIAEHTQRMLGEIARLQGRTCGPRERSCSFPFRIAEMCRMVAGVVEVAESYPPHCVRNTVKDAMYYLLHLRLDENDTRTTGELIELFAPDVVFAAVELQIGCRPDCASTAMSRCLVDLARLLHECHVREFDVNELMLVMTNVMGLLARASYLYQNQYEDKRKESDNGHDA